MSFVDYLIQKKVLTDEEGRRLAERDEEGEAVSSLLEEKGITKDALLEHRAAYFNIPFKHVVLEDISTDVLQYVSEESARHYQIAPLGKINNVLEVGLVNPDDIEARDALQFIASRTGIPFRIFLISKEDFEAISVKYQGVGGEVHKALGEFEGELGKKEVITPGKQAIQGESGEIKMVEDTPITKIVAVILRHATEGNASDIHIEHMGERVRVRFRVDGVLYTSIFLPMSV